jgi:hypothetical protein
VNPDTTDIPVGSVDREYMKRMLGRELPDEVLRLYKRLRQMRINCDMGLSMRTAELEMIVLLATENERLGNEYVPPPTDWKKVEKTSPVTTFQGLYQGRVQFGRISVKDLQGNVTEHPPEKVVQIEKITEPPKE